MMIERLAQHWHTTPDRVEAQDRALVSDIMEGLGVRRIFETPGSRLGPVERAIAAQLVELAPPAPATVEAVEDGARRHVSSRMSPEERARRAALSRRAKASGEVSGELV